MEVTQTKKDVQRLRESLGELPEPMVNPAFIVVSGLPGSGKSYFCRRLSKRLLFPILESDALRRLLSPTPNYGRGENDQLFRACHLLIEELLRRGIPLIFDATNLVERHREHLYHIADSVGARLILVRVVAPPELVRQRLQDRFSSVNSEDRSEADWEVYQKMSASAQRIRRNHFAVDTSKDITSAIDKIVREVNR